MDERLSCAVTQKISTVQARGRQDNKRILISVLVGCEYAALRRVEFRDIVGFKKLNRH